MSMSLPGWVGDVFEARRREFVESPDDEGIFGPPIPRAGATEEDITRLRARFSQPLEEHYVEFLRHSDGMENFALGRPIYGSRDWLSGRAQAESEEFLRVQKTSSGWTSGSPTERRSSRSPWRRTGRRESS
ncbi:hypothetical protein ACFQ2M_41520 [Kitasatospora saccharophila]|uniref:hypothetical protein n=1 Tax=Kitasatospora saccharophila TaxID=407973 RepID=UPI00363DB599